MTTPKLPRPVNLPLDIAERVDEYLVHGFGVGLITAADNPPLNQNQLATVRWAVAHYAEQALQEYGTELLTSLRKVGIVPPEPETE